MYLQDSPTRLLGRAQYHVNFPSCTEVTSAPFAEYHDKRKNGELLDGPSRSDTLIPNFSRSFTTLDLGENIPLIEQPVHHENRSGTSLVCDKMNLTESSSIQVPMKEISYSNDSQNTMVDSPHVTGKSVRDILAQKAFYTTSTQKLYNGVDWPRRIMPSPPPPETTKETHPDTVSFRFESRRYEPRSELWQEFGGRPFSWDYVQTRDGHHMPGPVHFCSPSKKIAHIPGYMGHVTGGPGEMDNPSSFFVPENKVRSLKPRYSFTARKANIPGYSGCVLYSDYTPACNNDPNHWRSTASRTYRQHDEVLNNRKSPFTKTSSMSRMVTLTHPFNPFNKVY